MMPRHRLSGARNNSSGFMEDSFPKNYGMKVRTRFGFDSKTGKKRKLSLEASKESQEEGPGLMAWVFHFGEIDTPFD